MLEQLPGDRHGSLKSTIARKRYSQYAAVFGGDQSAGAKLYLLDVEIRGALLELLHFVELPLRDTVHETMTATYGKHWYSGKTVTFDARTAAAITKAQRELSRYQRDEPDRVVAQLNLGFWCGLFEPGGPIRGGADSEKFLGMADYEQAIWQASLRDRFLGVAATREHAEMLLRRIRRLRNRVAHHESIVFGIHQQGEKSAVGKQVRQEPLSALNDVRRLMAHLCPHLHDWLTECCHTEELLDSDLATAAITYAKAKRLNTDWI